MESPSAVRSLKSLPKFTIKANAISTAYIRVLSQQDSPSLEDTCPSKSPQNPSSRNAFHIRIVSVESDGFTTATHTYLYDLKDTIQQFQCLHSLNIEIPSDFTVSNDAINEVLELASKLISLNEFSLSIGAITNLQELDIRPLRNVLNNCYQLKTLKFIFQSSHETILTDTIKIFEQSSSKLVNLQSIVLQCLNSEALENDHISTYLESCSKLTSTLTHVSLTIKDCPTMSDSAFSTFSRLGENFKSLNIFSLELCECPLITNKGIKLLTLGLAPIKELKQLSLGFRSLSGLDDQCLITFARELVKFQKVTNLNIAITDCPNVGIQGFYALRDFLTNFDELKKLNIKIAHMLLAMHSMAALCGAISVYKQMRELSLDFSHSDQIGEKALVLMKDIFSAPKNLKIIRIALDGWEETLTDKGMFLLGDSIRVLKNLKIFDLSLIGCSSISDKGLEIFEDMLDFCIEIKEIRLNFRNCTDLTELGWEHVLKGLLQIRTLKKLILDVTGCNKLVESFCAGIARIVERNRNIEHLEVYTSGIYEMTDKGVGFLKDAFMFLSKIKVVRLSYTDAKASLLKIERVRTLFEKKLKHADVKVFEAY